MTLREYLSLPYTLVMDAIKHPEMGWIRKAAYVELPDCVVEVFSPLAAMDELERLKIRIIIKNLSSGESVPAPGEPLRSSDQELELKRLGVAELIGLLDCDEKDMLSKVKKENDFI